MDQLLDLYQGQALLTISLNGIMGNTRQHCKLGLCTQSKSFRHPREEMSQTVMSTFNPLGNTSTTRCER
jgi:hypothetical protein